MDISHNFGNDLTLNENGDLAVSDGLLLSTQSVIRRLLTIPITISNPPDYLQQPDFGAGLPTFIGQLDDTQTYNRIKGIIISQMYLEPTVAKIPAPDVQLTGLPSRLEAVITYTYAVTNQQAVITFTV